MENKGFLGRLVGRKESPAKDDSTAPPPAAANMPGFDKLMESLDSQQRQIQQLTVQLAEMTSRADKLLARSPADLAEGFRETAARLLERDEEFISSLRAMEQELAHQTEMLQEVCSTFNSSSQAGAKAAESTEKIAGAIDMLSRSSAASVELMQQIRDRWANTGQDVTEIIVRQGRKTTMMLVWTIIALVLVATAMMVHGALAR